jgi:hypothetical protein
MRRQVCVVSWVVLVQLLVSFSGCKSGDDDDDAPEDGAGMTTNAPHAGQGSAGDDAKAGEGGDDLPAGRGGAGSQTDPGEDPGKPSGSGGSSGGSAAPATDGGSGNEPTPFPETPLSKLPKAFAGAICGALKGCLGESKLRELTRREACEIAVEAELRAKDFAHMDGSISAGRVLYDPAQLEECLNGITALECDVLDHTYPDVCTLVLDGNVELGDACVIAADCKGAAYCAGAGSCPSTCAALLGANAACNGDGQCANGLSCTGGKCTAPALAGDQCGATTGKVCALGLNCKGATDTEIGSCVSNAEIQVGAEGAACEPGGVLCKDGLSCVFDGAGGFHCEKAVGPGGACHLGLPGQCPTDEYCDATEVSAASTCRKLPEADKPCVLNGLCKGGLVCVSDVCRVIADNGGTCTTNAACRSGNCVDGKCEPPPACQ